MTKEEIIKELEFMKEHLKAELSNINGQHDAIRDQLCYVNSILDRIKRGEDNA